MDVVDLPQVRELLAQVLRDRLARDPSLRQEDIAELADVHQSLISNAINLKGKEGPSLDTFLRLVQATGTSLVQFFAKLEEPSTSTLAISPEVAAVKAISVAEARRDRAVAKAWDHLQRVSGLIQPSAPRRR